MMSAAGVGSRGLVSSGTGDSVLSIYFRALHTSETEKDEKETLVKECTGVSDTFIGGSIISLTFSKELLASKTC